MQCVGRKVERIGEFLLPRSNVRLYRMKNGGRAKWISRGMRSNVQS
jgi:hypothetical protein